MCSRPVILYAYHEVMWESGTMPYGPRKGQVLEGVRWYVYGLQAPWLYKGGFSLKPPAYGPPGKWNTPPRSVDTEWAYQFYRVFLEFFGSVNLMWAPQHLVEFLTFALRCGIVKHSQSQTLRFGLQIHTNGMTSYTKREDDDVHERVKNHVCALIHTAVQAFAEIFKDSTILVDEEGNGISILQYIMKRNMSRRGEPITNTHFFSIGSGTGKGILEYQVATDENLAYLRAIAPKTLDELIELAKMIQIKWGEINVRGRLINIMPDTFYLMLDKDVRNGMLSMTCNDPMAMEWYNSTVYLQATRFWVMIRDSFMYLTDGMKFTHFSVYADDEAPGRELDDMVKLTFEYRPPPIEKPSPESSDSVTQPSVPVSAEPPAKMQKHASTPWKSGGEWWKHKVVWPKQQGTKPKASAGSKRQDDARDKLKDYWKFLQEFEPVMRDDPDKSMLFDEDAMWKCKWHVEALLTEYGFWEDDRDKRQAKGVQLWVVYVCVYEAHFELDHLINSHASCVVCARSEFKDQMQHVAPELTSPIWYRATVYVCKRCKSQQEEAVKQYREHFRTKSEIQALSMDRKSKLQDMKKQHSETVTVPETPKVEEQPKDGEVDLEEETDELVQDVPIVEASASDQGDTRTDYGGYSMSGIESSCGDLVSLQRMRAGPLTADAYDSVRQQTREWAAQAEEEIKRRTRMEQNLDGFEDLFEEASKRHETTVHEEKMVFTEYLKPPSKSHLGNVGERWLFSQMLDRELRWQDSTEAFEKMCVADPQRFPKQALKIPTMVVHDPMKKKQKEYISFVQLSELASGETLMSIHKQLELFGLWWNIDDEYLKWPEWMKYGDPTKVESDTGRRALPPWIEYGEYTSSRLYEATDRNEKIPYYKFKYRLMGVGQKAVTVTFVLYPVQEGPDHRSYSTFEGTRTQWEAFRTQFGHFYSYAEDGKSPMKRGSGHLTNKIFDHFYRVTNGAELLELAMTREVRRLSSLKDYRGIQMEMYQPVIGCRTKDENEIDASFTKAVMTKFKKEYAELMTNRQLMWLQFMTEEARQELIRATHRRRSTMGPRFKIVLSIEEIVQITTQYLERMWQVRQTYRFSDDRDEQTFSSWRTQLPRGAEALEATRFLDDLNLTIHPGVERVFNNHASLGVRQSFDALYRRYKETAIDKAVNDMHNDWDFMVNWRVLCRLDVTRDLVARDFELLAVHVIVRLSVLDRTRNKIIAGFQGHPWFCYHCGQRLCKSQETRSANRLFESCTECFSMIYEFVNKNLVNRLETVMGNMKSSDLGMFQEGFDIAGLYSDASTHVRKHGSMLRENEDPVAQMNRRDEETVTIGPKRKLTAAQKKELGLTMLNTSCEILANRLDRVVKSMHQANTRLHSRSCSVNRFLEDNLSDEDRQKVRLEINATLQNPDCSLFGPVADDHPRKPLSMKEKIMQDRADIEKNLKHSSAFSSAHSADQGRSAIVGNPRKRRIGSDDGPYEEETDGMLQAYNHMFEMLYEDMSGAERAAFKISNQPGDFDQVVSELSNKVKDTHIHPERTDSAAVAGHLRLATEPGIATSTNVEYEIASSLVSSASAGSAWRSDMSWQNLPSESALSGSSFGLGFGPGQVVHGTTKPPRDASHAERRRMVSLGLNIPPPNVNLPPAPASLRTPPLGPTKDPPGVERVTTREEIHMVQEMERTVVTQSGKEVRETLKAVGKPREVDDDDRHKFPFYKDQIAKHGDPMKDSSSDEESDSQADEPMETRCHMCSCEFPEETDSFVTNMKTVLCRLCMCEFIMHTSSTQDRQQKLYGGLKPGKHADVVRMYEEAYRAWKGRNWIQDDGPRSGNWREVFGSSCDKKVLGYGEDQTAKCADEGTPLKVVFVGEKRTECSGQSLRKCANVRCGIHICLYHQSMRPGFKDWCSSWDHDHIKWYRMLLELYWSDWIEEHPDWGVPNACPLYGSFIEKNKPACQTEFLGGTCKHGAKCEFSHDASILMAAFHQHASGGTIK